MKKIFFFSIVMSLFITSCGYIGGKRVKGNGNWKTEERAVSSFDRVEVHGAIDIYIIQGPVQPVKIEADENLQKYIEVNESGSSLVIRNRSGYNLKPTGQMKIYVTAPVYKSIDVSGACNIYSESKINNPEDISMSVSGAGEIKMELDAPRVKVDISGAGSVKLEGETKDFDLELSGAGDAKCFDLKSENTSVRISGAGDADVFASVKLTGSISGAGSVKYKGNAVADIKKSGAGSVKKVE